MKKNLEAGSEFALAIIVDSRGSAPRKVGSKMLVYPDGKTFATIGGGSPEGMAINACKEALASSTSNVITYDLTQDNVEVMAPICGGSGTVMICLVTPSQKPVIDDIVAGLRGNSEMQFMANVSDGKCRLYSANVSTGKFVCSDGIVDDEETASSLKKMVNNLEPFRTSVDGDWYCERIRPEGHLYLLGGGHVSYATEAVARIAGFDTVVVDDREEFSNSERFPYSTCYVMPEFDGLDQLQINPDDFIVVVTRGHFYDRKCLSWALGTSAGYIGMIGSSRKIGLVFDKLRSEGVSQERLDEVHAPIGIQLGGNTPGEIAVSIVAEMILERTKRIGGRLKP